MSPTSYRGAHLYPHSGERGGMACRYDTKYRFRDKDDAIDGAEQIKARKGEEYGQLYPYRCPDGDHWHLSHHEQGVERCRTCNRLAPAWKAKAWVIGAHDGPDGKRCEGIGQRAARITPRPRRRG
ncbi:hypothetical protein PBI_YUNGJAMAL_17 [Mycobacterium phage YungJamal]|uniref:Uncharacterized protein n=1 Tax=Mycobacterium phage YungJamal TaxID=1505226 RepID=A0A076G828_BPMCO|nr:hypothetical protein PBI_YUNGJAMAL_17 [Mycobacterium phage YungJamal]